MLNTKALALHAKKIRSLQNQIKAYAWQKNSPPLALHYGSGHSNTTRSKAYKKQGSSALNCDHLDQIIHIDVEKRIALAEPRVTMEELVRATLRHGLVPPIVPEFKGITVGGAIMGGATESGAFKWGSFSDICSGFDLLCGDGTLLHLSERENADLFYAVMCSYGSLGALVLAEVKLIPAKPFVHLRYHRFSNPLDAIPHMQTLAKQTPDFLDGIVFSKHCAVVIEGSMCFDVQNLPLFSMAAKSSPWYYQHVEKIASSSIYEEAMSLEEYLFRYDQGAFWMGAYLFHLPLLRRFIGQGLLNINNPSQEVFTQEEVEKFHRLPSTSGWGRGLFHSLLTSQNLWKLLHKAEKWVQNRVIIQDCCIPEIHAPSFFEEVLKDPGTFPLWLCSIKGTKTPQIFAPHSLSESDSFTHFINFGIYGLPSYYASISSITKKIEKQTQSYGGRKVLYSRSYYSKEEFWQIYDKEIYDALRQKTHAQSLWHEITEKVLSE